jgi:hypothetical protein
MFPPSVSDFKTYFVRDFNFAPENDQNVDKYIVDADIIRAITESQASFNETLFGDNATIIFMYLVAYTLVVNIQNSSKGISSQAKFPISSNSVGDVSITFQIPDRYQKDALLQQYTKNGYGMKYLELALPYLVGVTSSACRTTGYG